MERWAAGHREAGGELFERQFDSLLRFCENKVDQGVEDLVQQTLLACVEGRGRFRGDASFRTYLFQIARYQLFAYYRSRTRREVDFEVTSVVDLGTSPTSALARREERRCLLEALRRIPLQYQIVVELRLWEDLSGAEMAKILEIAEPTLRSRLRIATERLRDQLVIGDCSGLIGEIDELRRLGRQGAPSPRPFSGVMYREGPRPSELDLRDDATPSSKLSKRAASAGHS